MRSTRRCVVAAVRASRARAFHAQTNVWPARRVRESAIREVSGQRRVDATALLRNICETLRNGVES
eukprot:2004249-Lingulodinium_polyedra.AAC.1